ncbi:uncharacterized protein METZ01_LOCUS162899, partial [marine metagenome]
MDKVIYYLIFLGKVMPSIEIQSFFYDLIHCKNKILSNF